MPKRDPEKVREYNRRHYAKIANDPTYRARKAAATAKWKKENPEKLRETQQKYRATEKGRALRRKYERAHAEHLNNKKRAYYRADPLAREKNRAKQVRRRIRLKALEAARRVRALEKARALAEKAAAIAAQKQYGIHRKGTP